MTAGIDWVLQTSAIEQNCTSVCFGNGLYVAVSSSGTNRAMTSPDGINWTSRITPGTNNWISICFGNNLFVAVASNYGSSQIMTSPDGITWTLRTTPTVGPWFGDVWTGVTYGNGLYVAVASGGIANRIMTSPDGITWTSQSVLYALSWKGIHYDNGLFVAVATNGSSNNVMTSSDGINWTLRNSGIAFGLWAVTYGNGLYVAIGGGIITSPDGITWTSRTLPHPAGWYSITFGNGLFVAVADYGSWELVMTSSDGINWVERIAAAHFGWRGVCYGNNVFVAVANTSDPYENVMISSEVLTRSIYNGDIHIHLQNNEGNISIFENDLKRDPTLENAVELSLFTDKRADEEDVLPDNSGNRRGYFGDVYHGNIGSKLWLLSRSKMLSDLPSRAEEYTKEALQWLIDDQVAEDVYVSAEFVTYEQILISIEIVEPENKSVNVYKYFYNWKEQSLSTGREA